MSGSSSLSLLFLLLMIKSCTSLYTNPITVNEMLRYLDSTTLQYMSNILLLTKHNSTTLARLAEYEDFNFSLFLHYTEPLSLIYQHLESINLLDQAQSLIHIQVIQSSVDDRTFLVQNNDIYDHVVITSTSMDLRLFKDVEISILLSKVIQSQFTKIRSKLWCFRAIEYYGWEPLIDANNWLLLDMECLSPLVHITNFNFSPIINHLAMLTSTGDRLALLRMLMLELELRRGWPSNTFLFRQELRKTIARYTSKLGSFNLAIAYFIADFGMHRYDDEQTFLILWREISKIRLKFESMRPSIYLEVLRYGIDIGLNFEITKKLLFAILKTYAIDEIPPWIFRSILSRLSIGKQNIIINDTLFKAKYSCYFTEKSSNPEGHLPIHLRPYKVQHSIWRKVMVGMCSLYNRTSDMPAPSFFPNTILFPVISTNLLLLVNNQERALWTDLLLEQEVKLITPNASFGIDVNGAMIFNCQEPCEDIISFIYTAIVKFAIQSTSKLPTFYDSFLFALATPNEKLLNLAVKDSCMINQLSNNNFGMRVILDRIFELLGYLNFPIGFFNSVKR